MNKTLKAFGLFLLCLLSLPVFTACEEDEDYESRMPVFKGFKITPAQPKGGDSVVFEVLQSQIGHLLYRADYTWTIRFNPGQGGGEARDTVIKRRVVYDHNPANPKVGFKLKEHEIGSLSATFEAEYSYSGQAAQLISGGTYNKPVEGHMGSITAVSSSQYYGTCRGATGTITVNPK